MALSLAFRIYTWGEGPVEWLERLRAAVSGDAVLAARLDQLLNPTVSEDTQSWQRREEERKRKLERQNREREQQRLDWIARLKANPNLVRSPPGLPPGEISPDQYWLLREVEGDDLRTDRAQGAAWRSLIEEFGEDVAVAYRDAAMTHWRHYRPGLRSEGADTNSIPDSLIFAMAGLAIEAAETDRFSTRLGTPEVRLALRYIIWELNGFPAWLESMHQAHPQAVMEAVEAELFWELANTPPNQPMHYFLQDLANYAPWLHSALVEPLLTWLLANDPPSDNALDHVLRILNSGGSKSRGTGGPREGQGRAGALGRPPPLLVCHVGRRRP